MHRYNCNKLNNNFNNALANLSSFAQSADWLNSYAYNWNGHNHLVINCFVHQNFWEQRQNASKSFWQLNQCSYSRKQHRKTIKKAIGGGSLDEPFNGKPLAVKAKAQNKQKTSAKSVTVKNSTQSQSKPEKNVNGVTPTNLFKPEQDFKSVLLKGSTKSQPKPEQNVSLLVKGSNKRQPNFDCSGKGATVKNSTLGVSTENIKPIKKELVIQKNIGYENGNPDPGKSGANIVTAIRTELKTDHKGLRGKDKQAKTSCSKKFTIDKKLQDQSMKVNGKEDSNNNSSAQETFLIQLVQKPIMKTEPKIEVVTPKRAPASSIPTPIENRKTLQASNALLTQCTLEISKSTEPLFEKKFALQSGQCAKNNKAGQQYIQTPILQFAHKLTQTDDVISTQDLKLLVELFRSDIESLWLGLAEEASRYNAQSNLAQRLIVAKIVVPNSQFISEHTFDFICSEIVGWIGKYQHQQLDTPIFYSMTNNGTHITIVCENMHAYECLEKCVNEILEERTMHSIAVLRMPPISKVIYCYRVVYSGIINDEQLFLTQVQLHAEKLQADRWIVVSHEVRAAHRKTHLRLLLDERSALALSYHHNNKLYICMQVVEFLNEGSLPLDK